MGMGMYIADFRKRLMSGDLFGDLNLPKINGRLDLSNSNINNEHQQKNTITTIKNVKLENIDFTNSHLESLRFFDSEIKNCVFDKAFCQDWRLWNTKVIDSNFNETNLRYSSLGAVYNNKRNIFLRNNFTKTDIRNTAYASAYFESCNFINTKLKKVEFNGSVFINCRLACKLEEVMFSKYEYKMEHLSPNEMRRVDFSEAQLIFTEFRELDMCDVVWPKDENHIIIFNYRKTLACLIREFENSKNIEEQSLIVLFRFMLKWAGENQQEGILHKQELKEYSTVTINNVLKIIDKCKDVVRVI